MTFGESIKTCFSKYASFNGRASRSEYWWFVLFMILASMAVAAFNYRLVGLFNLLVLLPSIAAAARRLHDTDRSGWWQLIAFIPLIGWIILIVLLAQSPREPNRFGPPPGVRADSDFGY